MAPRSVVLALAWALVAGAPLVWAGLSGDSTGGALATVLRLSVCLLPLVWGAGCAPGRAARVHEALLLAAVSVPVLSLAAPFSELDPANALEGGLYALAVLALCAGTFGPGGRQHPTRFALCATWVAATPGALLVGSDVAGVNAPWLGPVTAIDGILAGRSPTPALWVVAALAGALGLSAWGRGARPSRRLLAGGALSAGLLVAAIGFAQPTAQPLLRGNVRPGAAYPLRVGVDADTTRAVAQSYRHQFSAEPTGQRVTLLPTPAGSGRRLDVLVGSGEEALTPLTPPLGAPVRVSPQTLFVATLGAGASKLAAGWFPSPAAIRIALERADLPLLAEGGEALDVVVVDDVADDGVAASLRIWAASGGTLIVGSAGALERVARSADHLAAAGATGRTTLDLRPIGGGLLVGPRRGESLKPEAPSAISERLQDRLRRRARHRAMTQAILSSTEPGPSASLGRRAAWATLAALACFVILTPLRGRLGATPFVGGALIVGLTLSLLLRGVAAPTGPVYAASVTVLEAPAGARIASRQRWLTVSTVRPTQARLTFEGRVVPRPVFAAAQDAVRADLSVHVDGSGEASVTLPLHRARRTFAFPDAVDLEGTVRLTRGGGGRKIRISNESPHTLRDAFALARGGLYRLPNLPPGAVRELDLLEPPIPFRQWRLSALDHATRAWRSLVTAALSGRDLDGALLLIGRTDAQPVVRAGVAEELAQPPLLVITASQETR